MADHTPGWITATREPLIPGELGDMPSVHTSITINTSRLHLTSREQAEAESLIARLHALKLKSAVRKADEARGPFAFLRLPPELRLLCYAFLLEHHTTAPVRIDLATLVIPSIARVCARIRSEFLPWFFAYTPFSLTIASDLRNHSLIRARRPAAAAAATPTNLQLSVRARSGVLHMRKQVRYHLQHMGPGVHALLRDLVLRVCDAERWTFRKDLVLPDGHVVVEVALIFRQGKFRVTDVRENPEYTFTSSQTGPGFDPEQEALVVAERARVLAGDIVARRGVHGATFQGFGLGSVERIARVFRSSG